MDKSHSDRRMCLYCIFSGFALMNLVLFLHPMSPESFLELAFFEPLQTITNADGWLTAVFFWVSAAIMFLGLVGMLRRNRFFRRMLPMHKPDLSALIH